MGPYPARAGSTAIAFSAAANGAATVTQVRCGYFKQRRGLALRGGCRLEGYAGRPPPAEIDSLPAPECGATCATNQAGALRARYGVTVINTAGEVMEPVTAVILVVPTSCAVISPVLDTVAADVLLDAHVKSNPCRTLPDAS